MWHLEDPAEDVFSARVIFEGENYRVLEGLSEANAHHLQHMLGALEDMPNRGEFLAAKRGCRALLVLSELLCARADLEAFSEGAEFPHSALQTERLPTMRQLGERATFSYRELIDAGCDVRWLGRFILPPDERYVAWSPHERRAFDKRPLLDTGNEIIAALPSAFATSLREAVIETCIRTGNELPLRMAVLQSQTAALHRNPMIHSARIPGAGINPDEALVPSEPVEIEPGYWVHLMLLVDDLEGFEDEGLWGESKRTLTISPLLEDEIARAQAHCRTQPGFKAGLTFIVICGFGRTMAFGYNTAEDWFVQAASDYDVDVLGWLQDFDFSELFKLSLMNRDLDEKGFVVRGFSGLLATVGFVYQNSGHLVPHEALPDEFEAGTIAIPTNAHRELRARHHRRWDVRSIPTPEGRTAVVRRRSGGERSPGSVSRLYVPLEDLDRGLLRAVWLRGPRVWWAQASSDAIVDRDLMFRIWDMQGVWLERLAFTLDRVLPQMPDRLIWHLKMTPWAAMHVSEIVPATPEEVAQDVSSTLDPATATITTDVGAAFYRGLSRVDNVAEATLVRSFVEEAIKLSGRAEVSVDALMGEIVSSPQARQVHAFAPQDFRDHVRDAIGREVVTIGRLDDAAVRVGLGWYGVERPGGTLHGRDDCTAALNRITSALEDDFCRELAKFERRSLIEAAVTNHEAAATDRTLWHRTSGALIGLAEDEAVIRSEIAEHLGKLNGTFLASRILIEAGLSECPLGAGQQPAPIDLSRLMAKASMIFYLGGYSDAIRYGGMKPEIRISPAGQVQIDSSFFDVIMEPTGRHVTDRMIDAHRDGYANLLREPDVTAKSIEETVEADFLSAWREEVGASLGDFRAALEAIENRLVEAGRGWEILPRPELIAFLGSYIAEPEAYVTALESLPRERWKVVPAPYRDQDRQPWRFRRRLAVYRRPLLRLDQDENALVLVVPGLLRDSLLTMMHNFYGAEIDQEYLLSGAMRRWWNLIQDRDAKEFEEKVASELRRLGWRTAEGKEFSEILGRSLDTNPGDIDVLAWRADGRIILIECKNLQLAKTPSETAKQLSKFRGGVDEKGRPDLLAKHLKRLALAQQHVGGFRSYTGLGSGTIDGAVVFSNVVPMLYASQQIERSARLLTFQRLSEL
ncbi:hypothetical protein [Paracoccus marcusii]|uniref:hypothetical protein n=1 Tax=Paracoccus marcusii TaxID=59779 RepID=UPI0035A59D26